MDRPRATQLLAASREAINSSMPEPRLASYHRSAPFSTEYQLRQLPRGSVADDDDLIDLQ